MSNGFASNLEKYLYDCDATCEHTDVKTILKNYFNSYTGGNFETYGDNDPLAINSDDFIAVTMLSMEVKQKTKSGISPQAILKIEENSEEISSLLTKLQVPENSISPIDSSLDQISKHDAERLLTSVDSIANQLNQMILPLLSDNMSPNKKWVAASKLISRKRPSLIPIRDQKVVRRLTKGSAQTPENYLTEWWSHWYHTLTSSEFSIRDRLTDIQNEYSSSKPKPTFTPSLIRIADVLVWNGCDCNTRRIRNGLR
jgi:hypothetical protein